MSGEPLFRLGTRVDFLDVRAYLEARGWSRVPSRRPYAAIYRRDREPLVEVQVPLDRDLADYGDAMVAIARRVSEWEGRSVESILHDLLQARRDLPRFGLERDTTREMQPAQFVGQVSELMGAPGEQGAVEGPVVLQVQVEDELLKARVMLGAVEYRQAAAAHLEQRYVTVRGVLRRGPRIHWIEAASGFGIVGGPSGGVA
ncbi:hypothetical protein [Myxococcus qinghaiensis]|uniref:hypothetical protein n=1 Tax=Myxococcus qinghaiensis TaxID=2906758 RepID=UPI0020A73F3D|nr:hypothetical protein [Myxococcus qinghaiensis]MCP3165039.1 hypothetical protein [Myxococcus qinghaiensis]